MAVFKCKMCGGTIEFEQGASVGVCDSCGTKQTLPRLDNDKKSALYDRANHFRRNNEFDKAMGIYEQILDEDNTDAEAYWSLVLCKYGIEYVEDPTSHKRIPTVNRTQYTAVFDDENYKSALQYADGYQREIYEEEAKTINEIQKGILAISQREEPFDVFICYKETDNNGRRTPDSVLANDLYYGLTQEGFKVFFARITLEDKLGSAYEPYIFAALNSVKVMVVLGTKPEYFNAVWVKNEWSRYLALIKNGAKKTLIPAYKDMDPYDLPEEFAHLQSQDMSKLGFMQDLIRGIKKIAAPEETKTVVKEVVQNSGSDIATLLKRASFFILDGNWDSANEYCEKVLDINPENAEAYLYKLMAEIHVNKEEDIARHSVSLSQNSNFLKITMFGDEALKSRIQEYVDSSTYEFASKKMDSEMYLEALKYLREIPDYKDASVKITQCEEKIAAITKEYEQLLFTKHEEEKRINDYYDKAEKVDKTRKKWGGILSVIGIIVALFSAFIAYTGTFSDYGATFIDLEEDTLNMLMISMFIGTLIFSVGLILFGIGINAWKKKQPRESVLRGLENKYKPTQVMLNNATPTSHNEQKSDNSDNTNTISAHDGLASSKETTTFAGQQKSGGCYVATAVYGSYDCPEVWTLRRYRDYTLAETWYGRAFIRTYYAISPTLVKWFGHTEWFKKMWQGKLDRMVAKLQADGVESTPYEDKEW